MTKRILTVVGARPQFIKAATLSRAFHRAPEFSEILVHTGQHFDNNMSSVFFEELAIPEPAYNLDIHGGSHGAMTGRMLEALEMVMQEEQPDWVLVYGDTNSTAAGALAAAKLHIPIAHVEAGLRSFNRAMPEEINRVVADHLSSLLLCPTVASVTNLEREGILRNVHHVGDVMYDSTLFAVDRAQEKSKILDELGLAPGTYAVATVHRAENTDKSDNLLRVFSWLKDRAREQAIIFPMHPRTRNALANAAIDPSGLTILPPVGYLDMARLLSGATAVYTDSGGLQKEAYFHGKPCVTLRQETEWVELVDAGWNRLWTEPHYQPRNAITDYGEGRASEHILELLSQLGS